MSPATTAQPLSLEQLSALVDGELDADAVAHACAGWQGDPGQRAAWRTYHLIGDVMRSDDLASSAERDSAFLGALRERLAAEPVVLAPSPVRRVRPLPVTAFGRWHPRSWLPPAAVAAGFMAVAGVLVVMRAADPIEPASVPIAKAQPTEGMIRPVADAVVPPNGNDTPVEPPSLAATGEIIRDAQLDRYLDAHKQFAGSSALGVPSAFLRSATSDASAR